MTQLPISLRRNPIALAVCLALAPAAHSLADDAVEQLITPSSSVTAGIGYLSGDTPFYGIYNSQRDNGSSGQLDFSYVRRDDATGTWLRANGRDLGLDTRELGVSHEHQGDWRYSLEYRQIPRTSPYTVLSGVQGIGSAQLAVPTAAPGTLQEHTLKTERKRTSFSLSKLLPANLQVHLVLQHEDKDGERLFGRGTGRVQEFLAEPIRSTTRQVDFGIDYTGERLQLSGGYYGSFYNNRNTVLHVTGGDNSFNAGVGSTRVAFDNISLAPDNHAHQWHLSGGYQFERKTRLNFTLARSVAIQNDRFMAVNFYNNANDGANANTSGRTHLGGRVDTTLANLNITSRPISGLFLLAGVRYEDRDDKTKVAQYITNLSGTGANPTIEPLNGTSTTDGFNEPRSLTHLTTKVDASYLLPKGYTIAGGVERDRKERTMAGVRVVGYRHQTDEDTYRLEVRKSMSESLNGSLAYVYSDRNGTDFRNLVTLDGTTNYPNYTPLTCGEAIPAGATAITRCGLLQPIYLADRKRQKLRLLTDWSPTEALSAQLMIEGSNDDYGSGRGLPDVGPRKGDYRLFGIDLAYRINDRWKANTWLSQMSTSMEQATIAGVNSVNNTQAVLWAAKQKNLVKSLGVGVRGKFARGAEFGADLSIALDKTSYGQQREDYTPFTSTAAPSDLPDIDYRQQTLRLFGSYPVDKQLTVRLDYMLDRRRTNDWTWTDWTYSDGTRVTFDPKTTEHFVGLSLRYEFR